MKSVKFIFKKTTVIWITLLVVILIFTYILFGLLKNRSENVIKEEVSSEGHNVSSGTSSWEEEETQEMIRKTLENNPNLKEVNVSEEADIDGGNVPE